MSDELKWDDSVVSMDTVYSPMDIKSGLLERLRTVNEYLHEDSGNIQGPRLIYKVDDKLCYHPIKESVTVGRSKRAALTIQSEALSRIHFQIAHSDEGYQLDDQGSTNGVFVNEERVAEGYLVSGDLIRAGGQVFVFVED